MFLPADPEVSFSADLKGGERLRTELAAFIPPEDRESALQLLSRADLAWGAITSSDPLQGALILFGRFDYGTLKLFLSGRPDWEAVGKDGYRHRESLLLVRVPARKVLVVYYGYPDGETPPAGSGAEPVLPGTLGIRAFPQTGLPVTEIQVHLTQAENDWLMAGEFVPVAGKEQALLTLFKGYMTIWSRTGDDPVFTGSYRKSEIGINDSGRIFVRNLRLGKPLPFFMGLMAPGEPWL